MQDKYFDFSLPSTLLNANISHSSFRLYVEFMGFIRKHELEQDFSLPPLSWLSESLGINTDDLSDVMRDLEEAGLVLKRSSGTYEFSQSIIKKWKEVFPDFYNDYHHKFSKYEFDLCMDILCHFGEEYGSLNQIVEKCVGKKDALLQAIITKGFIKKENERFILRSPFEKYIPKTAKK